MAAEAKVSVRQISESASECLARDFTINCDRPESKGGGNVGPMGGEIFLLGLGGCFMSNLLAAIKAREAKISDWRTRNLTPIRSSNQNTSANPVYSTPYQTSNPFSLPDDERNLILYIFPKQRTDMGSIPVCTSSTVMSQPKSLKKAIS